MEHPHSDAPPGDLTAEQVAVLYRNVPIGIIATVVNATILVALEWPVVFHPTLLFWLFAMYAFSGFRALLLMGYRRQQPASWRSSQWYRWSIAGSTMAAVGWGNTVWFFHPPIPLPYEMIVVFVLAGMTAGATSVLCIAVPAVALYHLAIGVPIVTQFVLFGDAVHIGMAIMISLFLIGTGHAAWNLNRAVLTAISLRIQNQALVDSLTARTRAVERLNEDITKEIGERRVIEEALRKAHGDLERRIAERTLDLQRANDDLRTEVAERQRAETALRTSEARFRHLADNLNQAVWFVQVKPYRILYVSPAFERVWGVSPERCYEDPGVWRRHVHPDDKAMIHEAFDRAMAGNTEREFELTYRIIRPDGPVRWIYDRCVVHRNETGEIDRLSGISEDITESRTMEDQLRQAQKMEAVGRLAGGIAHDFNNIMTVILGYSAILLQEVATDSMAHRYVREIRQAGEHCAALTGQLLAFSRKQLLHPVPLDLHAVIRNIMAMLGTLIGEQISIALRLDSTPRWVRTDPVQLDQVLINLVLNARDAMPDGGTLTIETDLAPPTEVAGREHMNGEDRPYVRLRVHDTGSGMDPDTKARAFEPFFTTKPPGRGTGLGLATVYGIVHQSGGDIKVDSVPGRGTTMTVYLPEAAPIPADPASSSQAIGPRPGSEHILLVEDEPSVRTLTQHILRMNGYTVIEAEDGVQAIDLVRRRRTHIDLLITDMVMPGMNGKELASRLRAHLTSLRVLYMSGYSEKLPLTGEEDRSLSTFLQKPFSPEELIKKVREILNAPPDR
ncbi:MAG TPA: ATP-binding protein [Nitrospiraceae bacterium]|nr:ATP-binding protein [Nitrospiraceae bacterium]